MRKSNKRTIAIIAAVLAVIVLAVIVLLFVFNGKGGDAPDTSPTPDISSTETPGNTPDNSIPTPGGDTTTPDITTPDPGTSDPTETPGESDPPDTSEPTSPDTPTLKHPVDDPSVPAHPNSPYAGVKADIDKYYETVAGANVNRIISEVYETYASIVDPDVVNITFLRVFFAMASNNTLDNAMYARVNKVLEENGFGTLQGNGDSQKIAAILLLNMTAAEHGYGPDDYDELVYSYFAEGNNHQIGDEMRGMFYWFYYPWLSKDAP